MTISRLLRLVSALVFASLTFAPGAFAKDGKPKPERADTTTILVKFATAEAADAAIAAEGDRVAGKIANDVRIVRIRAGDSVARKISQYARRRGVVYAEPNYIADIELAAPNDPSYATQWALDAIDALEGWGIYPGSYSTSPGVRLAVVDTGVDSTHPDLAANVIVAEGANCLSGTCVSGAALDDQGHGTHVAGTAAAVTNNGVGVAGVAHSSRIVPVKVLDAGGSGDYAGVANGILWAANHDARVINLSLGGTGYSATLCSAVSTAVAQGSVVVAAAGNSGSSVATYPAACPGAIGVAATDSTGGSPSWSNFGSPNVFISAPGAAIYSTYWNLGSTYATLSGTSMAAPHVAGLAALLLGEVPARTPEDVKDVLASTASKIGATRYPGVSYGADPYGTCTGCTWHPYYGYGQIDADGALAVQPPRATITSFTPTRGRIGSTVTLTGTNLVDVSKVTFGFVDTVFTVNSPTSITATVPGGLAFGRWRVATPSGTAVNDLVFSIPGPSLTSFSTLSGSPGSTVTLTGEDFSDVMSVSLGLVNTTFTITSPTTIVATVPSAGLSYGRWRVTNSVGTAVDFDIFTVSPTRADFAFAPIRGAVRSTVTLTGTNFVEVRSVSLGFVEARFTVNSPTSITATVPGGLAFGRWRVTTASGMAVNDLVFSIPGPELTSFSPLIGSPGSTVTLTGSDFSDVTSVSLGLVNTSFTITSPTTIVATVPSAGLSYGRWRVTNSVGTAVDFDIFTVSS